MSDGSHRLRCPKQVSRPATIAAAVLATSAGALAAGPPAEAATAEPAATAIDAAMAAIGTPYAWGGVSAKGYDCSGLTLTAYRAAGVQLPRVSRQQYRTQARIRVAEAAPGDLLFWGNDPKNPDSVFHVAIYVGGGMILAAPKTGMVVQLQPVRRARLMPLLVRPAGTHASAVLPVRPGSRGADVKLVQRRLRANGYDIPVTGFYGSKTTRAVQDVQRRAGLSGALVGPATWAWLIRNGYHAKNR